MPDFETIVEQVSGLCAVLDGDGTVRYASSSVERLLGDDPESLVGERLFDRVHPDDRETVESVLVPADVDAAEPTDGTDASAASESVQFRLRHADGSWVWLETDGERQVDPESGGTVLTAREVTDRRELTQAVDRYEAILDSLEDGIYAVKPDGTVVYVNEGYASMKGVDREELLGSVIYDWGTDSALAKIRAAREARSSGDDGDGDGDVGTVEFGFSTVDGDTVPVEMRFNTIEHPDAELERGGVVRDVTERKARERALRRKNERLEEFASVVSHDLRNPLNVAIGRLDLARRECDSEHLAHVASAHDRMETLIADILTLAREGATVTETSPVRLEHAVERAWETVPTGDATLVTETDRVVFADRSRVQQLLENLVRNAVEHGGSDVTVTVGDLDGDVDRDGDRDVEGVSASEVSDANGGSGGRSSARVSADEAIGDPGEHSAVGGFFFEDDGVGIPATERSRVFDIGYSTADEGTGFGLGIVKQIVDAHGWGIAVTDGSDGGARFEVTGVDVAGGDAADR